VEKEVLAMQKFLFGLFMFALVVSFSACAQKKGEITKKSPVVQSVVITGTIDCMACNLKHSAGARAECKIYGHDHSLKVQQVTTVEGNPINVPQDTWYHILPNDNSKALVKEETYHGKKVQISGKLYAGANLIEVDTFNLIEK